MSDRIVNAFSTITVEEAFEMIRDRGGGISIELLKAMLRDENLMQRYDLGFAVPIKGKSLRYVVFKSKLIEWIENRSIQITMPEPIH